MDGAKGDRVAMGRREHIFLLCARIFLLVWWLWRNFIPGSDITQYPAADCFRVEAGKILEEGGKADALHHHHFCPRSCHHSFSV
mmetsp:Transcript_6683/g.10108  ORF Transcript_6683/g.10108 Transcript_6683/m.10108 type:complete len:84 (+) Transcript_6683:212-463(+)